MNCRLSGTWRATTAVWANNSQLPNIGEMYDVRNKKIIVVLEHLLLLKKEAQYLYMLMVHLDIKLYLQVLMMDNLIKTLFIMLFKLKIQPMKGSQILKKFILDLILGTQHLVVFHSKKRMELT